MPKWIVTDAQPIAKALGAAGNGIWNGMTMADGAGPGGSLTWDLGVAHDSSITICYNET